MTYMMKVVDKMLDWENAGKLKLLSVGYSLREPQLLFRKIEDTEITEQIEKLKAGLVNKTTKMEETKSVASKSEIVYDDFAKLELKAGTVIACEKVAKADKLLKLEVDLGHEKGPLFQALPCIIILRKWLASRLLLLPILLPAK